MARIEGPDFIGLQVRDLEASRRFYTEVLGLVPAPEGPPGAVVFRTEPIPFAVRESTVDLDAVPNVGWGVSIWLRADDPDAVHASLVDKGVSIMGPPQDGAFGRFFTFAEPDGYLITVHGGAR